MEIRIGVTYTPKEIAVEVDGMSAAEAKAAVEATMSDEGSVLWLTDEKGRTIGVPADKIAYIELGSEEANRPIGFG